MVRLFALLPLILIAILIERQAWRFVVVVLGGYLLLAGATGLWAYAIVPAQYTRNHQWARPPVSSSLGEQYGEAMSYVEASVARQPEEARRARQHVIRERETFVGEWVRLCAYGLPIPFLLVLWGWRTGWRIVPRRAASGA